MKKDLPLIGWREWISLPGLGIKNLKAKIDTGARTSALHAFSLKPFKEGNINKISFEIHPWQHDNIKTVTCVAEVVDLRWVSDSGGHREERYVIRTPIRLNEEEWLIDVTLTERDTMLFRMLLGRSAIRRRFLINPARSFLTTKNKVLL